MLQFTQCDESALPVNDSFILRQGYAETGDVEEAVRQAFFEEAGSHMSKSDKEILSWSQRKDDSSENNTMNKAEGDVAQWRKRQSLWYESQKAV